MNKEELGEFAEVTYRATARLMALVPEDQLPWRPAEVGTWWTLGQLLHHLPEATGGFMRGFLEGRWPEDDYDEVPPSTGAYPSVSSVAEAVDKLEASRKLAAGLLRELPDGFGTQMLKAPWDRARFPLSTHLHGAVVHQVTHKTELYLYLKLLWVKVTSRDLYAMD